MKIISLHPDLIEAFYGEDRQVLLKSERPVVLVIRMKFRGRRQDFAVPFRSNIPPASPKDEYFALPPRKTTRQKHRHGLHYIKMIPVSNKYFQKYRADDRNAMAMYQTIIDKNEKRIINDCQNYLLKYERGNISPYATNLDKLILKMKSM